MSPVHYGPTLVEEASLTGRGKIHEVCVSMQSAPFDLTVAGLPTTDAGVPVPEGGRFLVCQSTGAHPLRDAGVYIAHAATPPTRAADYALGQLIAPGEDWFAIGADGAGTWSMLVSPMGVFDVVSPAFGYTDPIVVGSSDADFLTNAIWNIGYLARVVNTIAAPAAPIDIENTHLYLEAGWIGNVQIRDGGVNPVVEVTGANPGALGFFAQTPVAQPVVPATSPTLAHVINALVALGLVAQHD